MRRFVSTLLTQAEHEVRECEDGAEAIRLWQEWRPDLVVMDLEMPRVDGLAATRTIRERHRSARVLILTAYDSPALRLAAREAGAEGYVLKSDLHALSSWLKDQPLPRTSNPSWMLL